MVNYHIVNLSVEFIKSDLLKNHLKKNILLKKNIVFLIHDQMSNINSYYDKGRISANLKMIGKINNVKVLNVLFASEIERVKENIRSEFTYEEYVRNLAENKQTFKKCA